MSSPQDRRQHRKASLCFPVLFPSNTCYLQYLATLIALKSNFASPIPIRLLKTLRALKFNLVSCPRPLSNRLCLKGERAKHRGLISLFFFPLESFSLALFLCDYFKTVCSWFYFFLIVRVVRLLLLYEQRCESTTIFNWSQNSQFLFKNK